jgi:hypothetical protein
MKEDSLFQKSKDQFRRMPQGLKAFSAIIAVLMLFFLGFALAGVLINYLSPGTFFYLFGYIGLFPALLLALISFVFFQIDLLVFVIRSHRPGFLFLNLLIIPLLCLTGLSRFADSSTTYERYIKEFDSSLVIASDSFLLGSPIALSWPLRAMMAMSLWLTKNPIPSKCIRKAWPSLMTMEPGWNRLTKPSIFFLRISYERRPRILKIWRG